MQTFGFEYDPPAYIPEDHGFSLDHLKGVMLQCVNHPPTGDDAGLVRRLAELGRHEGEQVTWESAHRIEGAERELVLWLTGLRSSNAESTWYDMRQDEELGLVVTILAMDVPGILWISPEGFEAARAKWPSPS